MDIILRFLTHRKALAGDIEKAFLNVSVAEEDRDVLRFLWFDVLSCFEGQIKLSIIRKKVVIKMAARNDI